MARVISPWIFSLPVRNAVWPLSLPVISATKFAERRLVELQQRLSRYRAADNLRPVAMTEGLVRREEEQLRLKLDRVSRRRQVDPTFSLLGVGVIRVH